MSHIHSLVNKANQKVTGQSSSNRRREERRERITDAWFHVRVHDEPEEEDEIPLKKKKTAQVDTCKQVQAQVPVPLRSLPHADEGLF